jgi:oligopeptide transport system substrate-binding protein
MSRKTFFTMSGIVAAASMLLAACAQPVAPAQPQVIKETVEVVKEVEKVVEKTVVVEATPVPAEKPKVLRINLGTYPDVIDPQKSSFVNEIAHLKLIYEGLTRLNEKLETVPGAAEKWEYNADATELTFTLRKGLKYSDGTPLNAKRFEYSIIRNINPATAGEYASITNEIAGAPEWQGAEKDEDKAKFEEQVRQSVQALDSSGQPCKDYQQEDCLTLKLKLSKPAPYFHTVMSLWVTYPAKQENIEEGGENW